MAPKLLVGLLGLRGRGLTCCCPNELTIPVIAAAVQGVVCLVGATASFAMLAKLLTASLLRDSITRTPQCFPLGITLGIRTGCATLPFALRLSFYFSIMTHLIASRSSSNAASTQEQWDGSGCIPWLWLDQPRQRRCSHSLLLVQLWDVLQHQEVYDIVINTLICKISLHAVALRGLRTACCM